MTQVVWAGALVVAVGAGWLDWRSRRIPNWLTLPAFVFGVAANTVAVGWEGTKFALAGAGVALGLLLPLVVLRGLGAGDWKLMGALGAYLGPKQILFILLGTIFITGMMALVQITRQKRWRVALGNLRELAGGFFIFGLRPHPRITLDNPGLLSLPFGVAVAVATILCYWGARH
ncbi:MAG TPA: A24 family peptidase [Candidatus Acidoferrales bacterium]